MAKYTIQTIKDGKPRPEQVASQERHVREAERQLEAQAESERRFREARSPEPFLTLTEGLRRGGL